MSKYHVNGNGEIARCPAQIMCRLKNADGEKVFHANSKKELQGMIEDHYDEKYGSSTSTFTKPKKKFEMSTGIEVRVNFGDASRSFSPHGGKYYDENKKDYNEDDLKIIKKENAKPSSVALNKFIRDRNRKLMDIAEPRIIHDSRKEQAARYYVHAVELDKAISLYPDAPEKEAMKAEAYYLHRMTTKVLSEAAGELKPFDEGLNPFDGSVDPSDNDKVYAKVYHNARTRLEEIELSEKEDPLAGRYFRKYLDYCFNE